MLHAARKTRSIRYVIFAVLGLLLLQLLVPEIATAAPTHTADDPSRSFWSLLALVPWAVVAGWLVSVVIPYISAKLTASKNSQLVGVLTAVLSLVDGFLSTLAEQGSDLDLRAALAASFGAWVIATKWHTKVLSGTTTEANLHATGPQLGKAA